MAKYHGIPVGAEIKPRRKQSGYMESTKKSPTKKKASDARDSEVGVASSQNLQPKLKRSSSPQFKDPSVTLKLKMIKNIRTQRAAAEETRNNEAVERAKLLIAEAEKAAKALEVAAMRNPLARSSLAEARKLIGEAVHSIESVKTGQIGFPENSRCSSPASSRLANYLEGVTGAPVLNGLHERHVNGVQAIDSGGSDDKEFCAGRHNLIRNISKGEEVLESACFREYGSDLIGLDLVDQIMQSGSTNQGGQRESNCNINIVKASRPNGSKYQPINRRTATSKKWVRGRLVEVAESY